MIDRYDIETDIREFSDGDWVKYMDYEQLEKENEQLKNTIKELKNYQNDIKDDTVPCSNCGEQMIYIDKYICDECAMEVEE